MGFSKRERGRFVHELIWHDQASPEKLTALQKRWAQRGRNAKSVVSGRAWALAANAAMLRASALSFQADGQEEEAYKSDRSAAKYLQFFRTLEP